ncbi:MAG: M20/M25/M40 family metallo-hydrolase, partial [Planctomycetota bacterium]
MFLAHMDVVPVEPGTQADWEQRPFSGAVVGGEIWGRGAMDDKTAVVGLLEATEALLANDFEPQRTIVLAFGHDEEVGGSQGATVMAARFEQASQRFAMI